MAAHAVHASSHSPNRQVSAAHTPLPSQVSMRMPREIPAGRCANARLQLLQIKEQRVPQPVGGGYCEPRRAELAGESKGAPEAVLALAAAWRACSCS